MRYSALEREVEIRLFEPADSVEDLSRVFRTTHSLLTDMALHNFAGQPEDKVAKGEFCPGEFYVAECDGRLIGAIVFMEPLLAKGCPYYERKDVACIGPFAVVPEFQGHGLGGTILDFVEGRALETGAREIALDVQPDAAMVIRKYLQRGYRFIERYQWQPAPFRSIIMSKRIG